ncbi:MAG TPA: alkaline phosphatase family protein [Bryobacteraceae bacterium]|nr:alkaline phosphatase family protein [Bryobacteraceae bacterium]
MVLVVLEQSRPDYLDAVWGQVSRGGLRRLIENGAYFPDCRHLASSFPATSVATLATATWPAQHGIVADRWYDRKEKAPVRASADWLQATTFAAQVAEAPNCRVFIVSQDEPRGSLFAGTLLASLFSMDNEGRFAARGDNPGWLADYNRAHSVDSLHDADWLALGAKPGAPALRKLKFDAARPQEFQALYRASPFAQTAVFDFAGELTAREKLGQGNTFDLLCLLPGASERLGYETGARSPLMQQMTLQLDRNLERLMDQLDRAPGGNTYDFVLAGGHGAPPEPPLYARPRMAVEGEALAQAIQRKLVLSKSGRVEKYLYPFLYLDGGGSRAPETAVIAAARAALEEPEVAAYFTSSGACSVHNEWERRFRNSFHPLRSGDLMLSYQPEYVEEFGSGRGITYGSIYDYDVKVPLCFYGPQFRPGVFEAPVESVDVMPTLARAIGVAPPSSSVGRVLGEAFIGSEEPIR